MEKFNKAFLKIADQVSFGMGTPANILAWIVLVAVWFLLGLLNQKLFISGNFLPQWFISTGWNFPLNTITTLAELYIGFLVAAATNRAQRSLEKLINDIYALSQAIYNLIKRIEKIAKNIEHLTLEQDQILKQLAADQGKELETEQKILDSEASILASETKITTKRRKKK